MLQHNKKCGACTVTYANYMESVFTLCIIVIASITLGWRARALQLIAAAVCTDVIAK